MQNTLNLRKWSDINGTAAVAIDTGTKTGVVEDFLFDPQTNKLLALSLKTSLFAHRTLLISSINAVGPDAITFASEDVLIKERDQDQLKMALSGQNVLSYRVLSAGGSLVGTVGNVILDITTPTGIRIASFELEGGIRERFSGHYLSFDANQLISYGNDVLVIPDSVAQALQRQ